MSEILIKGIQMPKSCLGELDGRNDCPIVGICENFKKSAFNVRVEKSWNQRLEGCPLVEVSPHGRLGDLDALAEHIKNVYCKDCKRSKVMCRACEYGDILDEIEDAPTIIEAST